MFKRMDHVALHVADVEKAKRFYCDVLGFRIVDEHIGTSGRAITYVGLGEHLIELTSRPGGEAMSGFHLCLEPRTFATAYDVLKGYGLEVVVEARPSTPRAGEAGPQQRAVFEGPHGEMIEIKGA